MSFTSEEFAERLARLRVAMSACAVDAMLIDDCEPLAYFTGYETTLNRYRACIVPHTGEPVVVLRALDAEPFKTQSWFDGCETFGDDEDAIEAVAAVLRTGGFASASIGYDPESHALTVGGYERLRRALPDARFVAMPGVPWELRLVKSPSEIACIRRAAGAVDTAMREIALAVRPGMSCRDIMAMAGRRLAQLGADAAHVGYAALARGAVFLHQWPSEQALERGDVLHLELVASYRGYEARLMRCIALGTIDEERKSAAEQLVALQDRQLSAMKPGALARDVDAILRDGVLAAGLREDYRNVTGYTLGYYSRAALRSSDFTRCFTPRADWRLEPGMVFHMYTSARGVSISETVLVTGEGAERLTKLERRIL